MPARPRSGSARGIAPLDQGGPALYDDEAVFATYLRHRQRSFTPSDTLEKPVIIQLIGEIAGKRILELGCGDAAIGRELLRMEAANRIAGTWYANVHDTQRESQRRYPTISARAPARGGHVCRDWGAACAGRGPTA